MAALDRRLQEINGKALNANYIGSLSRKYSTRNEFDKTISETENAFLKVSILQV